MKRLEALAIPTIEDVCVRTASLLDHPGVDLTTMLRLARTLKAANRGLAIEAQRCASTVDVSIMPAVVAMEAHLRAVLLQTPGLDEDTVRGHLLDAVREANTILEQFQQERGRSAA